MVLSKGVEVNSLMLEAVNDITYLTMWLRGQAELHSRDYATAVSTFKSLDVSGLLKNNSILMVNIAYCYNFMCEDKKAIAYLQRVRSFYMNFKNHITVLFQGSAHRPKFKNRQRSFSNSFSKIK